MAYVNRGPDARILGRFGGWIQGALSFRSPTPPKRWMTRNKNLALFWPAFMSIAIPRRGGRFWTFRMGWRWDENWGRDDTPPTPPFGGYIADVIIKTRIDHRVGHD